MTRVGDANLLFVNGVDLEYFLNRTIESSGLSGAMTITSGILTAGDVDAIKTTKNMDKAKPLSSGKAKSGSHTIGRGMEKINATPWSFPPEEPGEEAEFRFNPHVWTSPRDARIQVASIGYALGKVAEERGGNGLRSTVADYVVVY